MRWIHRTSAGRSMRFLLVLLLLVTLVPVLLVRVGMYFRWAQVQYQAAINGNLELARAAASTFHAYINDVAHQERTMGTALAFLDPPTSPPATDFLIGNASQYPPAVRFHWVDPQGRVINSSDPSYIGRNLSKRAHFQMAMRSDNWILADLMTSIVDGAPLFSVDLCIRDKAAVPRGVVAAIVDPHRLETEILKIGQAPGSHVMILDRQRRIVCIDPDIDLAWDKRSVPDDGLIGKALAGAEASGVIQSSLDGQQRVAAYVPIGDLGWVVLASRPVSSLLSPLREYVVWTGLAAGVAVAISLLLALLISRQIDSGVKRLQAHAAALAAGQLDHRADLTGIAELQAVAEAFNRMAASRQRAEETLRELNETLEQRVAERTAVAEQRATQLRAMAAELSQTEQRERRRLAQLLHDDLQQLLAASKYHAGALQGRLDNEALRQRMAKVIDLLDQSIKTSRSLTSELSPPILYDAGLTAALNWLARWMHSKHGLRVDVYTDEGANPRTEEIKVFLFQAARELLFNVVKHAGTDHAVLELDRDPAGQVRLVVRDAGTGFQGDAPQAGEPSAGGFGLFSIRERLELLGGQMVIDATPGAGTRIALVAPPGVSDQDPAPATQ